LDFFLRVLFLVQVLWDTFGGIAGLHKSFGKVFSIISSLALVLLPFFNFGKIFLDIGSYTNGKFDVLTETFIKGPGMPWKSLYDPLPEDLRPIYTTVPDIPAPIKSWHYMLMDILIYAILLWYFDNVIPNEYGSRRPLYFPFTFSYWGIKTKCSKDKDQTWLKNILSARTIPLYEDEEEEVEKERERALNAEEMYPIHIVNLLKVYKNKCFGFVSSNNDKVAVKNLCLTFEEGKLYFLPLVFYLYLRLALLGQNGAGKSTTMNILSGATPAAGGDALIYNYSVKNEMHVIRKFMGICPQVP
jgi:ABC-type multidrug transport system fused ATPase/permease subunit